MPVTKHARFFSSPRPESCGKPDCLRFPLDFGPVVPEPTRVMKDGALLLVWAANFYAAAPAGDLAALRLAEPSLRWSVAQSSSAAANSPAVADVQKTFAEGEDALRRGELDGAEAAFRKVLAADPRSGAAYANLGVIAMRRKDWDHALSLLQKAEKLEPKMAGIRLD